VGGLHIRAGVGSRCDAGQVTASPARRRALAVVGNPNSLASYAAGQDQAPHALRTAGLLAQLAAGRTVVDLGDLPPEPWRPDRENRFAQNWPAVLENLRALRDRLVGAVEDGLDVLVIGGNCTIAMAAVAAVRDATGQPPGLLYIDRHFDANTPRSVTDGALDWMGVAHALALPDTLDALTDAFGARPLLRPDQLVYLGIDRQRATTWEQDRICELGVNVYSSRALAADPIGTATAALAALPDTAVVVSVDVDVLDFTDAPLAEDTAGRNTGPTLADLKEALATVLRDPRPRVLCICELNPTRCPGHTVLQRFVDVLGTVLSA
jgi:arginase